MLVSYNWLKEFLNITDTPQQLAEKITRGGIEVEGVETLSDKLENIVVGYVKSIEKHPDAEKLNVCQVNVGDEDLQIVCGASNVNVNQKVIVAKVGAKLPGIKIKKAKLRGIESQGMICSLKELGLSQSVIPKYSEDGIYVFPDNVEVGASPVKLLGLDDSILDLSITPNRADALSIRGLTYEVSALYNINSSFNDSLENKKYLDTNLYVNKETKLCKNYFAQVVKDVTIEPSPLWLQTKLMNSGIRPINNIIDITNYVLLEFGQPMHAFDKDLIKGNITIRESNESEVLVTLDNVERKLRSGDIVIADDKEVIALAGVMGGKNTEVSSKTKDIILESAYFDSIAVRKASSYYNLRSESSSRFEKGIDSNIQKVALQRAVELILQLCPNAKVENYVGFYEESKEKEIVITDKYVNKILGIHLSKEEIIRILNSLGFITKIAEEEIVVNVPTRRGDISIKQDLVEEIIRIYGYDNLSATLPKFTKTTPGGYTYEQKMIRELRKMFLNRGFFDTINYSLVSANESSSFTLKAHHQVNLLMPMSETHSVLRQNLISGLLNTAAYNIARKQKDLKLLEIGKVFFGSGQSEIQPQEVLHLAGLITGKENITKWLKEEKDMDFFTAKGYLELVFKKLGLEGELTYTKTNIEKMHPGRTAYVNYKGEVIGFIGQIHPMYSKDISLSEIYVFEINLNKILSNEKVEPLYEEITKYPEITRDIALLINKDDTYQNIYKIIESQNNKLIKNIELFDLYQGIGLPGDKKSIALTITYSDKNKTLTDEEVLSVHNKILSALEEYGAKIR